MRRWMLTGGVFLAAVAVCFVAWRFIPGLTHPPLPEGRTTFGDPTPHWWTPTSRLFVLYKPSDWVGQPADDPAFGLLASPTSKAAVLILPFPNGHMSSRFWEEAVQHVTYTNFPSLTLIGPTHTVKLGSQKAQESVYSAADRVVRALLIEQENWHFIVYYAFPPQADMESVNREIELALGSLRPAIRPRDTTDGHPELVGVWGPNAPAGGTAGPWLVHRKNGHYSYREPSGRWDEGRYQVVGDTVFYFPEAGPQSGAAQYYHWEMQNGLLRDGVLLLKRYENTSDIPPAQR